MKLYDYFRSSAAYRVRIALNFKNIKYSAESINLKEGQQKTAEWAKINPQKLVPLLVTNNNEYFSQSLAIIEWLDEHYPNPAILPKNYALRCKARSLAFQVACDIHPLNNLRVLQYLTGNLAITEQQKNNWYSQWIIQGFTAIETQIESDFFCINNTVTMADICLIPQVYNSLRFKVDLRPFPKIYSVYNNCLTLPAFAKAVPEKQYDSC